VIEVISGCALALGAWNFKYRQPSILLRDRRFFLYARLFLHENDEVKEKGVEDDAADYHE
jgi:hypothetical protein